MQTAQTQLSAFLVAAGNAVQYVRQDEAVQLSTTVRLCMGSGLGVQALGLGWAVTACDAALWRYESRLAIAGTAFLHRT